MSNDINANKYDDNQNSRTDTGSRRVRTQIGELEYRILKYVLDNNLRYVTVAELSAALGVDKRRIWDALQRLVSREIAAKAERGLYEINREKAHVLVQLYEQRKPRSDPKDADVSHAARVVAESISRGVGRSVSGLGNACCDVVRIHVRVASGDGILFVFRVVGYAYYLLRFAREYLRMYLRSLGFSRSAVRRFISAVLDRIESFMRSIRVFFGVHGLRRYRAGGSDITVNLGSKEIGLDIVSESGFLEKFFVKIYSTRSRDAASRPLIEYVRQLSKPMG